MTSAPLRDLQSLCSAVQQQQSDAYKDGIQQLEHMIAQLEEIRGGRRAQHSTARRPRRDSIRICLRSRSLCVRCVFPSLAVVADQVSSGSLPTAAALTATQQHSAAARATMTKDFKALSTSLAKISTKFDKVRHSGSGSEHECVACTRAHLKWVVTN